MPPMHFCQPVHKLSYTLPRRPTLLTAYCRNHTSPNPQKLLAAHGESVHEIGG
jgi:hypothetical protein